MKKLTMILVTLLLTGGATFAQHQSKSDESLEFRPHWGLSIQGGAAHTMGEASFGELISPAAQLSATYDFHHAMGVRVGLSGWQGKGSVVVTDEIYRFRFAQLNADYVLNLASLFGGFRHDRIFNPYIFAGIGGAYGFDNKEAGSYLAGHSDVLALYWDKAPFFVGRAGVGADFQVAEKIAIGIEANANGYGEKFNSKGVKEVSNPDWQLNALVGVKFSFGGKTRPSSAYASAKEAAEAEAAAMAAVERAEAERLAAEKAAAQKAAAQRAEAERLAAEKAAAQKAAEEKAAAERADLAAENSVNVFFSFNSTAISSAEGKKLEKLAAWMKAHPDFTVSIVGYADKGTGTSSANMTVSERRAKAVEARLISLGVPAERISTAFKGDTVQPFAENDKNRLITCTLN